MQDEDEMPADERKARDAVRAFRELLASEGWRILKEVVEQQIKSRTDHIILTPRGDMKSEWDQEYKKGEVAGMKLVLEFPKVEQEQLEAVGEAEDARHNDTDDTDAASDFDDPGLARGQ